MYETEISRWQAVQRRDPAASSSFVYAVISTKIYCRPACPSRIARRANVCFYNTAEDAAAAGYRPCLRCKPDQPAFTVGSQQGQRDAVRRACEYIQETRGEARFADVAKRVGLSSRYLYGLFKAVMDTTPAKYATRFKQGQAVPGPSETPSAVSEAMSPRYDQTAGAGIDMFSWHALVDLDGADFAAVHENLGFQLHTNELYDELPMVGCAFDKQKGTSDIFDPTLFDLFDISASNTDQLEPVANPSQVSGGGRLSAVENSPPVSRESPLSSRTAH